MFRLRLSLLEKKKRLFFAVISALVFLPAFPQQELSSERPLIFTQPKELNWHSVNWPSLNFIRIPVQDGAAIYTMPEENSEKFKISFIFPGGVFSLPKESRPRFGALVDLLLLGGTSQFNYDQIQNYLTEQGISLGTSIAPTGELVVSAEALKQDFAKTISLLTDIILNPRFDSTALSLWKQQNAANFENLLNANTLGKQFQFVDEAAYSLAFGPNHYFATRLERMSPATLNLIQNDDVKKLYKTVLNSDGLKVFFAGDNSQSNLLLIEKLISQIPKLPPSVRIWLPERISTKNISPDSGKIRTELITKPGMTQCVISLRYYFPHFGTLNPIERIQMDLLKEIFSATGGVVGTDRFSKAMRANSGISYSPRASFSSDFLFPNTDVGVFSLNFQSPNERLGEAVDLAVKTWQAFLQNGVSQEELDRTRISLINSLMATEITVFDKMDMIADKLSRDQVPDPNPLENAVVRLDHQRNLKDINKMLARLRETQKVPVLVIMGDPTAEQITALKSLKDIELVETESLTQITEGLLKPYSP